MKKIIFLVLLLLLISPQVSHASLFSDLERKVDNLTKMVTELSKKVGNTAAVLTYNVSDPIQISNPRTGTIWLSNSDQVIVFSKQTINDNLQLDISILNASSGSSTLIKTNSVINIKNINGKYNVTVPKARLISALGARSTGNFKVVFYRSSDKAVLGTSQVFQISSPYYTPPVAIPSIQVTEPNVTKTWVKDGQMKLVQWNSPNIPGTAFVNIYAVGTSMATIAPSYYIAESIPNSNYAYVNISNVPDGSYYIKVATQVGSTQYSDSSDSAIQIARSSDTKAPTTPTNLVSFGVTETSTNLIWVSSTDAVGVAGYQILQDGTQIATTTLTSYTVTGLSADTPYIFFVKAFDGAGNVSGLAYLYVVTLGIPSSLTQVILPSLEPARNKADNATIRSILTTLRTDAENTKVETSNYNKVCGASGTPQGSVFSSAIDQITSNLLRNPATLGGVVCAKPTSGNANSFAISSPVRPTGRGTQFYCIDSTNYSYSTINRSIRPNETTCPPVDPIVDITSIAADNTTTKYDGSLSFGPIIKITAVASSTIGISSVKFYLKSATNSTETLISEDTSSPYTASVTTASYPNGKYYLEAVATNTAGDSATSIYTFPITFGN